jgi:hypothetical protein
MKRALVPVLVAAAAAAFALSASAEEKKTSARIADLSWLEGAWRHAAGDDSFDECWTGAAGGTMAAVSRDVTQGRTSMYELSTIETTETGLVLRIRHFGEGLAPWKSEAAGPGSWPLAKCEGQEAVFEDPARDFPRTIVYRRDKDVLKATLDGKRGDKPMHMEFELKRVSSK